MRLLPVTILVMSRPAMFSGDRFCVSRKGGTGGGMGAPKGCRQCGRVWLHLEKLLVGAQWAISLLLCTNGLRKPSSYLVGPPMKLFPHREP